ncbi:non-canonical purine NTP pyrophosphatase [Desmospora profundinema]|uniref:Non-canonical purine NTP pyrophosphatase (RdgB/HAM1 family) n=1 Tax=Desmospora profundinema TaxID=1571184 RepID=A0ABU1INU2_9BACL|nr:non-canonical purine NTP pyrophosphatase [Desmospora profundinema]MDR6225629.1 non-canonical purine NTP pyrophosphatase (RdgB/HAM1 family) [Desmospora profundinema]
MILPFATLNEGKLREARHVLSPMGIDVIRLPLELIEPDAGTIEEVTREKLRQVKEMGIDRVMVDDAGIFFAAYDHFPGILTKRIFERIGYKGIFKLLEGETRQAWFEGAIALLWDGETQIFSARTHGRLLDTLPPDVKPEAGFPFNPIFVPAGDHRTLAEMSPDERERYSYRGKVLKEAARWLNERNVETRGVH